MALLGVILHRVSGMRYRDYVSTQILGGSPSNLRLEIPLSVVALRAA
jgi:hypothetical protein